jgi:hypothetical protein
MIYNMIIFLFFLYYCKTQSLILNAEPKFKVKGKGKVAPVLFNNWAPRHEGVMGEWRYSSMHSWPWH